MIKRLVTLTLLIVSILALSNLEARRGRFGAGFGYGLLAGAALRSGYPAYYPYSYGYPAYYYDYAPAFGYYGYYPAYYWY